MKHIRRISLVTLLLAIAGAGSLHGQAARNWVAGYGLMYTNLSSFYDPGSDTDWVFDDNAFGFGVALQRDFGQGLIIGADFSLARPAYERRTPNTGIVVPGREGTANVGTAMATGRFAYGGGGDLGFYLSGGIGTIAYNLEDLGGWNTDFALRAGTGIEFRMSPARAIFLEWGRIWGYHEREGVGGGAAQHSALRLGGRFGL